MAGPQRSVHTRSFVAAGQHHAVAPAILGLVERRVGLAQHPFCSATKLADAFFHDRFAMFLVLLGVRVDVRSRHAMAFLGTMSRHRPRPVRLVATAPPENVRELLAFVDLRELLTAVLVVSAITIGSQAAPALFAQASDIIVTQAMFEFPMALLAVIAGYAEARSWRWLRALLLFAGGAAVLAFGSVHALTSDSLGAILPGLWLMYARLSAPAGVPWFSAAHCKIVSITAMTAWATLVGALAVLMLLALAPGGRKGDEAAAWVYAITWGGYYLALAFIMPAVRRRLLPAAKPRRAQQDLSPMRFSARAKAGNLRLRAR